MPRRLACDFDPRRCAAILTEVANLDDMGPF
jgi:hypothetical protein